MSDVFLQLILIAVAALDSSGTWPAAGGQEAPSVLAAQGVWQVTSLKGRPETLRVGSLLQAGDKVVPIGAQTRPILIILECDLSATRHDAGFIARCDSPARAGILGAITDFIVAHWGPALTTAGARGTRPIGTPVFVDAVLERGVRGTVDARPMYAAGIEQEVWVTRQKVGNGLPSWVSSAGGIDARGVLTTVKGRMDSGLYRIAPAQRGAAIDGADAFVAVVEASRGEAVRRSVDECFAYAERWAANDWETDLEVAARREYGRRCLAYGVVASEGHR